MQEVSDSIQDVDNVMSAMEKQVNFEQMIYNNFEQFEKYFKEPPPDVPA